MKSDIMKNHLNSLRLPSWVPRYFSISFSNIEYEWSFVDKNLPSQLDIGGNLGNEVDVPLAHGGSSKSAQSEGGN
jgi:hypothetical protein